MRRLAALLLSFLLLAGCGGGEEVGRVGGTEVRLSDVEVLYESDAVPADEFRVALFRVMAVEVIRQGLVTDFQTAVEPTRVDEYLAELEMYLAENGYTLAQYLGVQSASAEMLRFNAEVMAMRDAAVERLIVSPEMVDGLFADPKNLTNVCVQHIVVATEEEAETVKARLEAGEDFATVAGEVSLDTSSPGGNLGCKSAANFVDSFADAVVAAPLGEVVGPVATQFGFHILIVGERQAPTREEYLADPRGLLTEDQLSGIWSDWYNAHLQAADAWVAERYGTWTPAGIDPPAQ